jgi:hypothetical protein
VVSVAVLVAASAAQAVSIYGELLTVSGGARATLTTDFGYGDFTLSVAGAELIAGLPNDGWVGPLSPLSYTHYFEPGVAVDSIESAWLYVGLVDDATPLSDFLNPNEIASIAIDGSAFASGSAVLNVLGGSLAITTFSDADHGFGVTVSSTNGTDFRVAGSLFKVKFNAAPPVPEPSAIAVFGLGVALVGFRLLRRRSGVAAAR